jgi:hypothetical protein
LRPALEVCGEFVGRAEIPVAGVALVNRAVGDVVGVLDQSEVAGTTKLKWNFNDCKRSICCRSKCWRYTGCSKSPDAVLRGYISGTPGTTEMA